jgi:hypothetical protein
MQHDNGGFYNFALDWEGDINRTGGTSWPGGQAWTARGFQALGKAAAYLAKPEYRERFERCLAHERPPMQFAEIRALQALAVLTVYRSTLDPRLGAILREWADEIAACRDAEGRLLNHPAEPEIHLWGREQPKALALVGMALDSPSLVELAVRDARLALAPSVRRRFEGPQTQVTFEVTTTIKCLRAVWRASHDPEILSLMHEARAWLRGRNAACAPVYDAASGLVHDGVDETRVSANSGAEANVEGAMALFEELPWALYSFPVPSPHQRHTRGESILRTHPARSPGASPTLLVPEPGASQ